MECTITIGMSRYNVEGEQAMEAAAYIEAVPQKTFSTQHALLRNFSFAG